MKNKRFRFPGAVVCLALLLLALVLFLVADRYAVPAMHTHWSFCPLTLSRFERSRAVPVVYGLPTEHALEEARQGRIVLGGCLLGSTVALCPHCHAPVEFRDWNAEYKELHAHAR
jgi:hypothetical protein